MPTDNSSRLQFWERAQNDKNLKSKKITLVSEGGVFFLQTDSSCERDRNYLTVSESIPYLYRVIEKDGRDLKPLQLKQY